MNFGQRPLPGGERAPRLMRCQWIRF
jgi:hypothetical protein